MKITSNWDVQIIIVYFHLELAWLKVSAGEKYGSLKPAEKVGKDL